MENERKVSLLLDGDVDYYTNLLNSQGAVITEIFDITERLFTDKNFEDICLMSESEIKQNCVVIKNCNQVMGDNGSNSEKICLENYSIFDKNHDADFEINKSELKDFCSKLENGGFYEVLQTFKMQYDFRLRNGNALSLQEIDSIGVVLTYFNSEYENMPSNLQREAVISELNSYGFEIDKNESDIDVIKTLITGQTWGSCHF